MSDDALRETIFRPVAQRIQDRGADSLLNLARFLQSGIEGWLKVETARALEKKVERFLNVGPDLLLTGGLFVELKGATDCNVSWILSGLKYPKDQYASLTCRFLGGGKNISSCLDRLSRDARVIEHTRFTVGADEWIVGLIGRSP